MLRRFAGIAGIISYPQRLGEKYSPREMCKTQQYYHREKGRVSRNPRNPRKLAVSPCVSVNWICGDNLQAIPAIPAKQPSDGPQCCLRCQCERCRRPFPGRRPIRVTKQPIAN
jgi:hypothetical protein